MSPELITASELAERLRMKPKTIIGLAREGKIPRIKLSRRIVRFDYEEVVQAMKALAAKEPVPKPPARRKTPA